MEHLIDKDHILAKIENLENTYKECPTRNSYEEGLKDGRLIGYKDALHKIDTLEVKEVNLEKEIAKYLGDDWVQDTPKEVQLDMIGYARHFFELGLNAQKGE